MACMMSLITISAIILSLAYMLYKRIIKLLAIPETPVLKDSWWGPGGPPVHDATDSVIEPFTVNTKDEILKDLQHRLEKSRPFIEPLENVQHQYGINTRLLTEIVDFWKNNYNFKEREQFLNKYPQFTVKIQGLKIHYLHVKPKISNEDHENNVKVLPLLMLHGWPGSVREFYDIIPLLTEVQPARSFVFEIIAPSLPGYGFSDAAVRPGLGTAEISVIMKNLMKRLGHNQFYIQGGDWGAVILHDIAVLFPEHVLGIHTNMCVVNSFLSNLKLYIGTICPSLIVEREHISKMYPFKKIFMNLLLESGYMHLQATKPDTVGVALNDSPVGLAAYILEKFITWTNPNFKNVQDGCLNTKYTYTNLLDNVMIYWITNSITTSMRLYAERFSTAQNKHKLDKIPVLVPTAVARFSYEILFQSKCILQEKYKNIVHMGDYEGGHFAAFENPNILAKDIFNGIEKMI